MSSIQVYSIRDNKVGTYNKPVFTVHLAQITRELATLTDDPQTMYNKHTQDFELYKLGTYNEDDGSFKLIAKPEFILNLSDLKSKGTTQNVQNQNS